LNFILKAGTILYCNLDSANEYQYLDRKEKTFWTSWLKYMAYTYNACDHQPVSITYRYILQESQ